MGHFTKEAILIEQREKLSKPLNVYIMLSVMEKDKITNNDLRLNA